MPPSPAIPRRLVLLGSVLVDMVVPVPALPPRGGDVVGGGITATAGGGFTVLSAATRLGLPALFAGAHGTGRFGDIVRAALAADGVDLALPACDSGDTGCCLVLVEPGGERTFVTAPGVEARLAPAALAAVPLRDDDAVYLSGYDLGYPVNGPTLAAYVEHLPVDALFVVDPGPLVLGIPFDRWSAVLARVGLLSLSEREAELLWGADVDDRAAAVGAVVVVRRGAAGARLYRPGALPVDVPAVPVAAVDTTGAGDVHVAAMLAARSRGADWPAAVEFANRAAAVAVTRAGPGTGPTAAELGWPKPSARDHRTDPPAE